VKRIRDTIVKKGVAVVSIVTDVKGSRDLGVVYGRITKIWKKCKNMESRNSKTKRAPGLALRSLLYIYSSLTGTGA
jgi:hypothetical protein